jgi:hypothetical protein
MKSKILKILGVVLTLSLAASLGLAGAVVADVSQPVVTVDPDTISAAATYTVLFQVNDEVSNVDGEIIIEFPSGTDVPTFSDGDIEIQSTAGFGTANPTTAILAANVTEVDETVTIVISDLANPIGEFAMVKVDLAGVVNPDDPGEYTLFVETSEEDTAVESAVYEIDIPDIAGRPGIIEVYNPGGILMDITYGDTAMQEALLAAGEDFTLVVGPGTYNGEGLDSFVVTQDGLTIEASGAAEDTIWDGGVGIVEIDGANEDPLVSDGDGFLEDIAISGLTFDEATVVVDEVEDPLITDCIFEDETVLQLFNTSASADLNGEVQDCIFDGTPGTTDDTCVEVWDNDWDIEDCEFLLDEDDVGILTLAEVDITGCTFNGSSAFGIDIQAVGAVDITGCFFYDLETAILATSGTVTILTSEIWTSEEEAIIIDDVDEFLMMGCTFSGNEDDLLVNGDPDTIIHVHFNNFVDNGVIDDNGDEVHAEKNWWGDADPDLDNEGDVEDTPVLGASVVDIDGEVDLTDDELDAKSDLGIKIEVDGGTYFTGVAQLQKAPGPLPDDQALGAFYDILILDNGLDEVMVRMYNGAVDANTMVQCFTELAGEWVDASHQGVNEFSQYAWFTVDDDSIPNLEELVELPVVLVKSPPSKGTMDLNSPIGDSELSNVPFTWDKVSGAVEYTFVLSASPELTSPLVETTTTATAYQYTGTLSDGVSYFWQVTASDGEFIIGESAIGAFVAQAPPVEEPPVINIEAPPAPNVTIEQPAAETPMYIWIIIGIGALLLIFVIILIMRTRRAV